MDRRKVNRITAGFVVLVALVVSLMLVNSLRRSAHITLPAQTETPGVSPGAPEGGEALTVVEITPDTVQAAIATLDRPAEYRRTIQVEQVWSGGSGMTSISVAVSGGRTRTDRTMPDKQVRHAVTDGTTTYIWYNQEQTVYSGPAGGISADNEQIILTYEDVLALPAGEITAADYQAVSDVRCIYVETAEDAGGYVQRYWVSVDTGLLVAAERLLDGETVYRMGALTLDAAAPTEADFTLPDGTVVPAAEG